MVRSWSAGDTSALETLTQLCLRDAGARVSVPEAHWRDIYELAVFHGVAPYLWSMVADREVPSPYKARLAAISATVRRTNERLAVAQREISHRLEAEGLPFRVFKGVSLAEELYGEIGLRDMTDVDILIRGSDLARVDEVFQELGFTPRATNPAKGFRGDKAILYQRDDGPPAPVYVDVHERILTFGRRDPLTRWFWTEDRGPELTLVLLSAHQVSHRFSRLRLLLDIRQLLKRFGGQLDWEEVKRYVLALDFAPGIWFGFEMVNELSDVAIPDRFREDLHPGRASSWLLERLSGPNSLAVLRQGARLSGPYGALTIVAAARGVLPRFRHLWQLSFPPTGSLVELHGEDADRRTITVYLERLYGKLRAIVRSTAGGGA